MLVATAWDQKAEYFEFAVSSHKYDNRSPPSKYVHCYPNTFAGVPSTPNPGTRPDMCRASIRKNGTDASGFVRVSDTKSELLVNHFDECCSACNKDNECRAWIATEDLKPDASGFNCWLGAGASSTHPTKNRIYAADQRAPSPYDGHSWWILGNEADWYLAPAATASEFTSSYYGLTGPPAMPPRYAFGFMATYWGYNYMEEVVGNMTKFRDGRYPIDSFIMDYDWWNCGTSPGDDCKGHVTGQDFQYDPVMWGNHTFGGQEDWPLVNVETPADILNFFHQGLGSSNTSTKSLKMRFGGIRKPRAYSHVNFSKSRGWLLPREDAVGAGFNNWNFTRDDFLQWYANGHEHFLRDGIDFWWNDEGETQWFTYYFWNMAQQEVQQRVRPNERMFTLNRAFTPGMQRFPAVTWTGDMQDCSHAKALEFVLWGQPYMTCDLTSPGPTVLLRQYQGAVWWPIMRVHQMHGVPRFPWLWGGAEHQIAFRSALNTRYALIPTLYSLAHAQMKFPYMPMVRPASFVFPEEEGLEKQYMVGNSFVISDLSVSHSLDPKENHSRAILPWDEGKSWFVFNTTRSMKGGQTVERVDLALDEFPVYVRAGTIVPIHPFDNIVQHSAAQRGILELQVYPGRNASFAMIEDDGFSNDYAFENATRTTIWKWNNDERIVSWTVDGPPSYTSSWQNDYTQVRAAVHFPNGTSPVRSSIYDIGTRGSISIGR